MGNFLSRLFGDGNSNKNRSYAVTDTTHGSQRNTGVKASAVANAQTVSQENLITPTKISTEEQSPKQNVRPKLEPFATKEAIIYTTTFETDIDAAPPHPLEEQLLLRDIDSDQIEIDTNLVTPEVEDAVIKIQAGIRGFLARKQIEEIKKDNVSVINEINTEKNNKQLELISDGNTPIVPPPPNFGNNKNDEKTDNQKTSATTATADTKPTENLAAKPIPIIETNRQQIERSSVETKPQSSETKPSQTSVEQQLVEVLFDDRKLLDNSQVVAIELTKQVIINNDKEQPPSPPQQQQQQQPTSELINTASSTTVEVKPIKDSNEKVYKASVEQFGVLKRVQEPNSPPVITAMATDTSTSLQFNIGLIPVIEEQREIEISSTHHTDSATISAQTPLMVVQEVLPSSQEALPPPPPSPQPTIQVEEQNGTILDAEEAATRIQAAFRGFQTRRTLSREASPNRSSSGSATPVTPTHDSFLHFRQTSDELFITTSDVNKRQDSNDLNPSDVSVPSIEESINATLDRLEEHLLAQMVSESSNEEETENLGDITITIDDSNNNIGEEILNQQVIDGISAEENVESLATVQQQIEIQPPSVQQEIGTQSPAVVAVDESAQTQPPQQQVISIDIDSQLIATNGQTLDNLNELATTEQVNENINTTIVATEQPSESAPQQLSTVVDINRNTIVENVVVDENLNATEPPIQQQSSDEQTIVNVESVPQSDPIQITPEPQKTNIEILTDLVESWSLNSPPPPTIATNGAETTEHLLPHVTVIAASDGLQNSDQNKIQSEEVHNENLIEILADSSLKQPPQEQPLQEQPLQEQPLQEQPLQEQPQKEQPPQDLPIEQPLSELSLQEQPKLQVTAELPPLESPPLWQESQIFTPKQSEETKELPVNNVTIETKPTAFTPTGEESKLHGILKQTPQTPEIKMESPILIRTELSTPETGPSTSEEISSPDDDPEFTGLSPNSPMPIRSSSPNPFGKKRRKPRKSGSRKNQ